MPFRDLYRRQAALLIRVLPHVARGEGFALKGGTAINLFIRNMPRLSVDIDLTYLPIAGARLLTRRDRRGHDAGLPTRSRKHQRRVRSPRASSRAGSQSSVFARRASKSRSK